MIIKEQLEQENKQLKEDIKLDNAFWKQECDSLQKELAEKYKEIDALNKTIFRISNEKEIANHIQNIDYFSFATQIRKQVCDEIREKLIKQMELPNEDWVWVSDIYAGLSLLKDILDQIEKGESNE